MFCASAIKAASTVVRPAVSRISTSADLSFAACMARLAIATGVSLSCSGRIPTPASSPSNRNCSRAARRVTSSDASMTDFLSFLKSCLASLPAVVVLPLPCKPTIRITAGGVAFRFSGASSGPSISINASLTILTTIWPGVTDFRTSLPTDFSLTTVMKALITDNATSASIKASRTSRKAVSTSVSVSAPRPRRRSNTDPNFSLKPSNMSPAVVVIPCYSFFILIQNLTKQKRRLCLISGTCGTR